CFVRLPTAFVCPHLWQIAFLHEAIQLRDRPHLASFLLRVSSKQCFRYNLARFATRLLEREDLGRTDLVLTLASALVGVALIIGFASRLAHFKEEATLREIKIICLLACGHTDRLSHEPGRQSHNWHSAAARCPPSAPRARSVAL